MKRSSYFLIVLPFLVSVSVFAEKIELPEEELARESVLPVFEKTTAVLNRAVETKKRFQLGLSGGLEINEPFYSDYIYGLMGAYHFTEVHGMNVQFQMWNPGLSSYGEQIKTEENLDPSLAPQPRWSVAGNYEFIAYYGKISLSKQTVMNLNLFANIGAMYVNIEDRSTIGLNLGLGQTFFMSKSAGIRLDLKTLIFKAPNPASVAAGSNPTASSFSEDTQVNNQITASLIFIL